MAKRPNILIICADQLRTDALGFHGNPICRTPALDALAAESIVFENAFSPNPICVPARAAITTGNYSHLATGFKANTGRIRDNQPKLAEHFASFGYRTYACGKLHYVPYSPPGQKRLLHGFGECDLTESGRLVGEFDPTYQLRGLEDYIDYLADVGWCGYSRAHGVGNNDVRPCPSPLPEEHHVEHWVADRAIERLRQHRRSRADQPFLIWYGSPKPHSPYDPPAKYAAMYDPRQLPPPLGDESMLADRDPSIEVTRVSLAQTSLSPAARHVVKAYYYGLVSFQDAQIARVVQALKQEGVYDETIIVFTCDHGDLLGDFGAYFKGNFLNPSVRVPLVIKAPHSPAGAQRRQLAGLQDILPTLAALAGCPLSQAVQGLDLSGALLYDRAATRELFYSQCMDSPRQSAMITDGRWKYCYAQWGATEELYDLAGDPHELENLARPGRGGLDELLEPWRKRLMDEARRLKDAALLDGAGLVSSPLDRAAIAKLPISGMGWRWY